MTMENEGEQKLYAGKYKTVEELEEGYKNNSRAHTRLKELETEVETYKKVPDDYQKPDVGLADTDFNAIKQIAKNSGLTQTQFDKLAKETAARIAAGIEATKKLQEDARKEVGEDKISILKDYVSKFYPTQIGDAVLDNLITNKDARQAAFEHRDQLLQSKVPGMQRVGGGGSYVVSRDDVLKAREEVQKRPHDIKARERYINLTAQVAQSRRNS